jgi:hypothetical protein
MTPSSSLVSRVVVIACIVSSGGLVHFDLVLWDVHAYLVVDFLPNAFRLPEAVVSSDQ